MAKQPCNLLFQYRGLMQLPERRDIEQQFVRHAAPQEVREPGCEGVVVQRPRFRACIRRLGPKEEVRRHKDSTDGEQHCAVEGLAALPRRLKQAEVRQNVCFFDRTSESSRQEFLEVLTGSLLL